MDLNGMVEGFYLTWQHRIPGWWGKRNEECDSFSRRPGELVKVRKCQLSCCDPVSCSFLPSSGTPAPIWGQVGWEAVLGGFIHRTYCHLPPWRDMMDWGEQFQPHGWRWHQDRKSTSDGGELASTEMDLRLLPLQCPPTKWHWYQARQGTVPCLCTECFHGHPGRRCLLRIAGSDWGLRHQFGFWG